MCNVGSFHSICTEKSNKSTGLREACHSELMVICFNRNNEVQFNDNAVLILKTGNAAWELSNHLQLASLMAEADRQTQRGTEAEREQTQTARERTTASWKMFLSGVYKG